MKLRPQLALLFMTGYADSDVLKSWIELGYLTLNKPFSSSELDMAIRQTIRSRAPLGKVVRLLPDTDGTHRRQPRADGA
jgi:hypothetical protein